MPDFSQQSYWDTRFTSDPSPYDWLLPARFLCDVARDMLGDEDGAVLKKAEILHIGCGTSDAGVLRRVVERPEQVHNVDYSEVAVRKGEEREREIVAKELEIEGEKGVAGGLVEVVEEEEGEDGVSKTGKHDSAFQEIIKPPQTMRWSCMDLLSLPSTLTLLHRQQRSRHLYDLILDKSTSDSISCGPDQSLPLPYPLSINGWTRRLQASGTTSTGSVHPLHLLAVHLAALTTPRTGRWIAISYSEDRFPFLPPFPQSKGAGMLDDGVIKAGFPHPWQLWRLERKERVEIDVDSGEKGESEVDEEEETLAQRKKRLSRERELGVPRGSGTGAPKGRGYVHRPKVGHWVYVLRRTEAVVVD